MWKKIKPYAVSVGIALLVGGVAALLTKNSMNLYQEIRLPPISPPSWLFPVVWTVLYILMGISSAKIYTDTDSLPALREEAIGTYAASLLANFGWSLIFFNHRAFLLSFLWLLVLLYLIVKMIIRFHKIQPWTADLQIPYAVWVAFAGYLNFAIWILNR